MTGWLRRIGGPADGADVTLVCLPPGGGGPGSFHGWRDALPPQVGAFAVAPPGRGDRISEDPVESVRAYVAAVAADVAGLRTCRLALVGVSLGGMLAFEVCRTLTAAGRAPGLLATIAAVPPASYDGRKRDRSPAAVRSLVAGWGLTDPELLEFDEFADVVLPPIATDLRLGDGYDGRAVRPVPLPLLAIAGSEDEIAPPSAVRGWRAATRARHMMSTLQGGHYVHDTRAAEVLALITSEVR